MPLWLAVVLLASAVIGIVLCRKYLRRNKTVRILGISICVLLALACILYIGAKPAAYIVTGKAPAEV